MSGIPYKLDGLDGDNEVRATFSSFYASEALVKGDAVAIDTATSTNGLGNNVLKADTGDVGNVVVLGVAAEAIASGDVGQIQVGGVCTFAKLLDTSDVLGNTVAASGTAGSLTLAEDQDDGGGNAVYLVPCGIILAEGTANTADSTVYLFNTHNI